MILGDFNVEAEKKVMKDFLYELSLFRIEGGRGGMGSFSPVASTNVEISPQNFLSFSFNPFTTLV